MSKLLLEKILILGCPNVGKSKFLESLNNQIFTPIKKDDGELKYFFVEKNFKKNQERTRRSLSKYIKTHSPLYLDEPFYYLLPFEEKLFWEVLKRKYIVATHRTAYFLLSSPSIILINKKGQPLNLKISELGKLIRKPSFNFFKADLNHYSEFLNQFNDIHLTPASIRRIKMHPDFRNIRTTYLVRDFLIWFSLHPGDFDERVNEYKVIIKHFFKTNCKKVPKNYQKVINKCLGCFGFLNSQNN